MAGVFGALTGGTLAEVLVAVGVDTKQLDAGLQKAKVESETAGQSVSKFGLLAKAAMLGAGIAAVKFAADSIHAAAAHEQALSKLSLAIGHNTANLEEQANALAKATGFTSDEIIAVDTIAARFKLAGPQMEQFTQVTLDYARATGTDAVTAAQNLSKAALGATRPLKVLGLTFKATGDQTKDMGAVLDMVSQKIGGSASAYAQTFAGKMDIVRANMHELAVTAGTTLLPIVSGLATALTKAIEVISPLVPLLPAVAVGFIAFKVGALAAAAAGSAFGVSMEISLATLGPISAALGLVTAAVMVLTSHVNFFTASINVMVDKGIEIKQAMTLAAASGLTYVESLKRIQAAEKTTADQAAALTQALKDQKTAEQALAGGMVGLISAHQQLIGAQQQLNKDRKSGSATASQLKQDELGVLQAALGQKDALKSLADNMRTAGASSEEARLKLEKLGGSVGLSKKAIDKLVAAVYEMVPSFTKGGDAAGRGLVAGVVGGISSGTGDAAAAAANLGRNVLAALRASMGVHSPSTEGVKAGQSLVEGLVLGMSRDTSILTTAASDLVNALKSALGKGIDQATLDGGKAIERLVTKFAAHFDKLKTNLASFKNAIRGGFASFKDLFGTVGRALSDYQQQLDSFNQARAAGTLAEGQAAPTAPDLHALIAEQVAAAKAFADALKRLQAMGLSRGNLAQLAGQGAAGLGEAQALLADPSLIRQMNAAQSELASVTQQTSNALGDREFGAAIRRAREHLGDFSAQIEQFIGDLRGRIANAGADLARTLERITTELGNMSGLGGGGGNGGAGGNGNGNGRAGGDVYVTVNVAGSVRADTELAKTIQRELLLIARANGGNLGF